MVIANMFCALRKATLALPLLPAALTSLMLLQACAAHAGEFHISDSKASDELSEVTRIYIDGTLAATIRLDDKTQEKTVKVMTPAGRVEHTYTLCGQITIRNPEGMVETHEVSSDGILHHPDGRLLYALGSNNFTEFYLLDPDDPDTSEHHTSHSRVCSTPVS